MPTQLIPGQSTAIQNSYQFGNDGAEIIADTVPQLPNGSDTKLLFPFEFNLGTLGPDLLEAIDAIPGFELDSYVSGTDALGQPINTPQVHFTSPSVGGYSLQADLRADLAISLALQYNLDFGQLAFTSKAV